MREDSSGNASSNDAKASNSEAENRRSVLHLGIGGMLLVLFFWPAFSWAGEQLASGDEPWQLVFVPFLSVMVLSRRVPEMRGVGTDGCAWWGVPILLAGALFNLFGIVIEHPLPSQVGMIVFVQGAVLFAWGKRVYRRLAFPLLYLFLAVPLPRTVLVATTGSLKTLGAVVAGKLLSWIGFAVVRDGAILNFPTFTLVVEDECSGLQSLIILTSASLPMAYLMSGRFWKKTLVVLISVPVALVANVVRLMLTAILAQALGESVTRGWRHALIGAVTVFVAFLALYGLSNVLSDRAAGKGSSTEDGAV